MNEELVRRDVVVIGASAGGVEALTAFFEALPGDFPGIIALVLHRRPLYKSGLLQILGSRSRLEFLEPCDGEIVRATRVYVAPRDHHMTFDKDCVRLDRGPKVHFTRPAADPLFRSAASSFGHRVAGIVLSGTGEDCLSGLISIKAAGGIGLAQDPEEAVWSEMPIESVNRDHIAGVFPVRELAKIVSLLARGAAIN